MPKNLGALSPGTGLVLGILVATYFTIALTLSLVRYWGLYAGTWDLGLDMQALWTGFHSGTFCNAPNYETYFARSFFVVHPLLDPVSGRTPLRPCAHADHALRPSSRGCLVSRGSALPSGARSGGSPSRALLGAGLYLGLGSSPRRHSLRLASRKFPPDRDVHFFPDVAQRSPWLGDRPGRSCGDHHRSRPHTPGDLSAFSSVSPSSGHRPYVLRRVASAASNGSPKTAPASFVGGPTPQHNRRSGCSWVASWAMPHFGELRCICQSRPPVRTAFVHDEAPGAVGHRRIALLLGPLQDLQGSLLASDVRAGRVPSLPCASHIAPECTLVPLHVFGNISPTSPLDTSTGFVLASTLFLGVASLRAASSAFRPPEAARKGGPLDRLMPPVWPAGKTRLPA